MTTITNLVDQIDRDLMVHYSRPLYDLPSSSYDASTTTIALASTDTLAPGAILDSAFELMYVTNWEEGIRTATVIRGFLGTTAATGTTSTLVRINPRFPTAAMLDCVLDELRSWDERLFNVEKASLSFDSEDTAVAATPTAAEIYRVLYARPRPQQTTDVRKYQEVVLRREEATSQFSSGYSLHVREPYGDSTTVDVAYAVPFDTTAVTTTSSLESIGLTSGMFEILKWGALARLMAGKEAGRLDFTTFSRPDVDQSVPATAHLQASAQYGKMRDNAYDREVRRLLGLWPVRFFG